MESIADLVTVAKVLYNEEVAKQRDEIKDLKKKLEKERLSNHYLFLDSCTDGSGYIRVIQAKDEDEVIQKVSQLKAVKKRL